MEALYALFYYKKANKQLVVLTNECGIRVRDFRIHKLSDNLAWSEKLQNQFYHRCELLGVKFEDDERGECLAAFSDI